MKVEQALLGINRLFLDTAPVIYLIERNPRFFDTVQEIFVALEQGDIQVVTSPITLAECLVGAYQANQPQAASSFTRYLTQANVEFVETTAAIADQAAKLRVQHKLVLADAIQLATALQSQCQGFLTNDIELKRVTGIQILVVDRLSVN